MSEQMSSNWEDLLVSSSEIDSFEKCERKWGFGYVEGIRGPSTPAQQLGTEVDDEQIQPYLRDGRGFDFTRPSGEIAASMLVHLPKPGTVEIQKKIFMPSPSWQTEAFGYLGYADIYAHDSIEIPGCQGGVPGVADTKTSSDISAWAKTEKQLRVDSQPMLYATYALYTTGARAVDIAWIYGQTKKTRKSKSVIFRIGAAEVVDRFGAINDTAITLAKKRRLLLAAPDVPITDALPPNPDHCEAFGGCSYRDLCNLSPVQILEAHASKAMRQTKKDGIETMSTTANMLANLRAKAAAAAGAPVTPPVAQPVAPPPAAPAPTQPLLSAEQIAAMKLLGIPVPASQVDGAGLVTHSVPTETMQDRLGTAGVVPPSSALFDRPLPPAGPSVGINPPESALPPAPAVGMVERAPEQPAAAAPARRGRPPKDATATQAPGVLAGSGGETFTVTWGMEKISPVQFNSFDVGPFQATGTVQSGEPLEAAMARVYNDLTTFANAARDAKALAFLEALGGAK